MNGLTGAFRAVVLAAASLAVTGCATIINGPQQKIQVNTNPAGAAVTENGSHLGTTPVTVRLARNREHTLQVALPGYDPAMGHLSRSVDSPVLLLSCCLTGILGLAIDFGTGSMYKLSPESLTFNMARRGGSFRIDEAVGGASGPVPLAVASFEAMEVSAGNAAVIADLLRDELVKSGEFRVVEKSSMEKLLAEQAFQQSGCTTSECAVKLGKVLNVRYIIVGSFGKLLDTYMLNIRMVSVESARIVWSDSARANSADQVEEAVARMAKKLADDMAGGGN